MNLPATPQERAALVRMVAASASLIVAIGRAIKCGTAQPYSAAINETSAEFVDAVIEVQEQSK